LIKKPDQITETIVKKERKKDSKSYLLYLNPRKWIKEPSELMHIIHECPEPQEQKSCKMDQKGTSNSSHSIDIHDKRKSNSCTKIPSPPKSDESDGSLTNSRIRTRNPISYTLPSLRSKLRKGKFGLVKFQGTDLQFRNKSLGENLFLFILLIPVKLSQHIPRLVCSLQQH
jgi:hypothetical protein